MSKSTNTAADLRAALAAIAELQKECEALRRKAEGGIVVEYVEGISKQGKAWNGVQVKGGALGWRGVTFRSLEQVEALAEHLADVRFQFEANASKFEGQR